EGGQDGFHMTMGFGGDRAKGLARADKGFPLEGAADDVDESFRQVREVAEGAMLDLAILTIGAAQQVTDVSPAVVLAHNLGHMDCGGRTAHAGIVGLGSSSPRGSGKYSWLQMESRNRRKAFAASR